MKKIKINNVHEYDLSILEKKGNTIYIISYSNGKQWNEHARGSVAMTVIDNGNGLKFTQRKKDCLEYDEAELLRILLSKYIPK